MHRCWQGGLILALLGVISGCGGGSSVEDDMRRYARTRKPAAKETTVAAPVAAAAVSQATPDPAPNTVAASAQPTTSPAASPAPPGPPSRTAATKSQATSPTTNQAARQAYPKKVIPRVEKPKEPLTVVQRRARTLENLSRIGAALRAATDANAGRLPAAASAGRNGEPNLSWRVELLPYLGHEALHQQFRLNEPWDSPYNELLLAQIPPVYQSPERFDSATNYLAVSGEQAAFGGIEGKDSRQLSDGHENTLLVVETDDSLAVPWTKPDDYPFTSTSVGSGLGGLREDGFFGILGDGRVKRIPNDLTDPLLRALFVIDDGENIRAIELVRDATSEPAAVPVKQSDDRPARTDASAVARSASAAKSTAAPTVPTGPLVESTPTQRERLPVPADEELSIAREKLRQMYSDEQSGSNVRKRAKLSQTLLADSSGLDAIASEYHEILRIARDLAVESGEVTTALSATELLCERFEINRLELRLKTVQELVKSRHLDQRDVLVVETRNLARDAFDADAFDIAIHAAEAALLLARGRGDKAAIPRISEQKEVLQAAMAAYANVPAACAALAANPLDPSASQIVSDFQCLVKGNWSQGLPLMAQSSDLPMKILARIDLEPEKTPAQMIELADQYWEKAETHKQPKQFGLHLRAAHWYQQASVELPSSLDKARAIKRYNQIVEQYGKDFVERRALVGTSKEHESGPNRAAQ